MAMGRGNSDLAYQDRITQKKKVVNDLLALRRMKLMQRRDQSASPRIHSPQTGRVYEAYKVAQDPRGDTSRVTVSREQVRGLLNGTSLEEELHKTYGERALDDATEHYVNIVSGGKEVNSGDNTSQTQGLTENSKRQLFLHKLLKERKLKLEAMRQKRYEKEQALLEQKTKIRLAKIRLRESDNSDARDRESDSSDENLNVLVSEVKRNIGGLEKHIKDLKQKHRSDAKQKKSFKKPRAIDYEFKPWQEEQVQIATSVVDDIIKGVLDICVYSDDNLGSATLEALLKTDSDQYENMVMKGIEHDAILSIIDEIEEEVSSVVSRKTAEECTFLIKMIKVASCDLVINSTHIALTGKPPKDSKDALSTMIDKMWMEMATHRLKSRRSIWAHSQRVISKIAPSATSVTVQPTQPLQVEESEGDVTPLSYEQTPATQQSFSGEVWDAYVTNELSYWEYSDVNLITTPFSLTYRKIIGISCLKMSYDNRYVALGSHAGDVLVYDVTWQPFRPIRCVSFVGKTPERIIRISWTLDRSRILTLSSTQCLIVWSISFPSLSSASDLRHLGIPDEKDDEHDCQQLTALCILEGKLHDFAIKEGPLASSVAQSAFSNPVTADFFPNINLAGTQNFIVVGFESGDILKCDLSLIIASRMSGLLDYLPEKTNSPYILGNGSLSKVSKMANGIEIELFRSHRNPITLIHFMKNNGDMITLDQKLNINVWRHDKEQLSGFNWFTPFRKLRLTGTESVMVPKGEERVVFEDEITSKKQAKGKKRKGKQIIERERKEAMTEIRILQLQYRKPWHSGEESEEDKQKNKKSGKFQTKTYAPTIQEIVDPLADQTFHIVTKQRSTNVLVRYATRVYSVSSQACKTLVEVHPSSNGQKLYFLLLYGKHPPNIKAHVTFVDLDLNNLDMLQSMIIKLDMSKEEYDKCIVGKEVTFTVTRRFMSTNTEYIYCSLAGRMHVFSTRTGSEVAWCAPDKRSKKIKPEHGLELPPKLGQMTGRKKLMALCPDGKQTHVILQAQPENRKSEAISGMFTILDTANLEARKNFNMMNKQLLGSPDGPSFSQGEEFSMEQCVREDKYSTREMPPAIYIRMNLNSIIDNAVAMATGKRMAKEQRVKLWAKDWEDMQQYFNGA